MYGDHIEDFDFLNITFDIGKARRMISSGDVLEQGDAPLRNLWKWINLIDVDQEYAANLPAERLQVPVIVAKFADQDVLVDGYHRLTKAISLNLETLPFVSLNAIDIVKETT